ncbi:tyrosine-type recombinase/integrase [Lachnospiraceae bacterium ZAX-1]
MRKYARGIKAFVKWLDGAPATQAAALGYKAHISKSHAPTSVNSMLAAINGFFAFYALDIKAKPLKIQKKIYSSCDQELTRVEYERLLRAAMQQGNERLSLVMQTICSTGIRVSELQFVTIEVAKTGRAEVTNKGKTRTIFIPLQLKNALLRYAKAQGISTGHIFVSKNGKPLNRSNIWTDMKKLCAAANVASSKVFPHNLRHLFARCFYGIDKDIVRLADILGHSRIDTTRIYVRESGAEHRRRIEQLNLVMT